MILQEKLPVEAVLADVEAALRTVRRAVLVAPPGAGKTTMVPLHLIRQPDLAGRIILVQPRRIAARAAATRMASLLGEAVGETVGWRMRLDTRVSAATRIEVVTEGVFTRLILSDPELSGVSAVLFDEFHERSLDADFGLALALDVQAALREDLAILVMSATLDGARVATLLGDAPVIETLGRSFPVDIRNRDRNGTERLEDAVADVVRQTLRDVPGSILAFLPGQREIERVRERLEGCVPPDVMLAPLYGALATSDQDLAIRPAPPGRRKVVLATSIAETSITIDGVTVVIDSGLARRPVFEPASGLSRLETVPVSRAAATQRAGRAGRTGPGTAIRLWRAEQTNALPAFDPPEILSTDLSGLLLDCAAFGVGDPTELRFLDAPPKPALAEARLLLRELGALDADGRPTEIGRELRQVGLPPRLGTMVIRAGAGQPRRLAAELAVLLTERGLGGNDPDLAERHRRWRTDRSPRGNAARGLAERLARQAGAPGDIEDADAGRLLAVAYTDRVAVARGAHGHFLLASGRGGQVDAASTLAASAGLVVAELQGQARAGRITSAIGLDRRQLAALAEERAVDEDIVLFDAASGAVRARRVRRIGRAVLSESPLPNPPAGQVQAALAEAIRQEGMRLLPLDKDGERLLERLRFLHASLGEPWPDLAEAALMERLDEWVMAFHPDATRLSDLRPERLRQGLISLLPGQLARQVDEFAPSHYEAPTGSRLPLRYEPEQVVLAVRVQEMFGITRHPAIAGDRVPLTLELLSPAHRPIQITRDLPGFWAGSWREVRADLRGRYPKHVWPEDPALAAPTARAKPRGN
ncbi:ATP-dependent helicase HrpB [Aureimonas altamirensis]|uniref:ATP-dependent helicase HrpB n=1 Tax=Aureimonas altamirensis TaxID=370622 RepID=UPI002036ED7B|nr:ATP-dependent helicase HrpB [Aureimonas altamirensis]MCM2505873.1 ATP-dependent helicase HrpB [Aureimonas altamirensis]